MTASQTGGGGTAVLPAGLRLVALTGDDEHALRDGFAVREAVARHDVPDSLPWSWRSFAARPAWPYPGSEQPMWVVYDGEAAVAWCGLDLQLEDNRDLALVELEVHPEHRRRGIGRALLQWLREELRPRGRTRALFEITFGGDGERFLRAVGARMVVADTERRLDVAALDVAHHERLLADALDHAGGYDVVHWVGPTPAELRSGVALMQERMSTDPPLDDLQWEPESYDAERVAARDRMMAAHGMRVYSTAARHAATGDVVGLTTLVVFSDVPEFGDQWETIVLEEHRGHRLGLALKVTNLLRARDAEPALHWVHTWNAGSNAPMLAVNVAMGFTPVYEGGAWELEL